MKIVDFTNATSPKLVSEYSPKESVRDVAIGQNEAYLLCDSDLIVLDISNHKAPRFLSKIAFEDTLNDNNGVFAYGRLMLSDSILYVGRNSNKFYIVNVKDPSHPKIDSYLATREATVDIAQYGKYVYIAEADAGILIIDISNSKNIIDSIFISISPLRGMCISDNKLLLADAGPFSIYDITDPIQSKV